MIISENAILELPRKSVNYLRNEDRVIGETEVRWVPRQKSPGGRHQKDVAYERPNGERFRVTRTVYLQ